MAEQGATLHNCSQELVKYIEHIRSQREKLNVIIDKENQEKASVLNEIESLNRKLCELNESLCEKIQMRDDCERTLDESEAGLKKIIESSQILLTIVQREAKTFKF